MTRPLPVTVIIAAAAATKTPSSTSGCTARPSRLRQGGRVGFLSRPDHSAVRGDRFAPAAQRGGVERPDGRNAGPEPARQPAFRARADPCARRDALRRPAPVERRRPVTQMGFGARGTGSASAIGSVKRCRRSSRHKARATCACARSESAPLSWARSSRLLG